MPQLRGLSEGIWVGESDSLQASRATSPAGQKNSMSQDERYERYRTWCELLRVEPAEPETYFRTVQKIHEYYFSEHSHEFNN